MVICTYLSVTQYGFCCQSIPDSYNEDSYIQANHKLKCLFNFTWLSFRRLAIPIGIT